jgi:very-short-patch-repair endonuclease
MPTIKEIVRRLRQKSTPVEKIIWKLVRNNQINGLKVIRQYPIAFNYNGKRRFFVADFYCHKYKLVVELDGKIHENQKERDELRTYIINQLGRKVVRFTNEEIGQDVGLVTEKLKRYLSDSPSEISEKAKR